MPTVSLLVSTTRKLAPLLSEALFLAGAQGLEERLVGRAVTLVTYAERRATLVALWKRTRALLASTLPTAELPQATFQVADESWKTDWTEHLRALRLTPRLWLSPTTSQAPTLGRGQALLRYQPALAFGDGDHPTTRLASRAIEAHYRAKPGGALLDIGAGTGVLSFVALLSGARRARGTDIDPEAVRAAKQNAKLNGLAEAARFAHVSARITGPFDLAVVNIELRPLLLVLASLPAAARRAPRLLVTGFLKSQSAQVTSALKAAGFRARRLKSEGDWLLLEGRR